MTITIACEPVPGSRQSYFVNILEDQRNISGWVGGNLYKIWVDEQPPGKRNINFLRNKRFTLKNGLVWRLKQQDDTTEPRLEVILEDNDKVSILADSLRRAEVTGDNALDVMQTNLQTLIASGPKSPDLYPSSFSASRE